MLERKEGIRIAQFRVGVKDTNINLEYIAEETGFNC